MSKDQALLKSLNLLNILEITHEHTDAVEIIDHPSPGLRASLLSFKGLFCQNNLQVMYTHRLIFDYLSHSLKYIKSEARYDVLLKLLTRSYKAPQDEFAPLNQVLTFEGAKSKINTEEYLTTGRF
jgi:hypothetical protein